MKNYGVILGQRAEDYIAGVQSPIVYEERNPSGDWTAFLPAEERQSSSFADSMACVSYSALNSIETQLKFLTGVEPNFSDRALAKMSDTQSNGNFLWRVGDTIRNLGLVPDEVWPAPANFTWDTYYASIPPDIVASALSFLNVYTVQYEWLPTPITEENLEYQLKHSPIQVTIPGHAVLCFYSTAQVHKYFDTYSPFRKSYTPMFDSAMKYVVTPKQKLMTEAEVKALQALEGYDDPAGATYWAGKPLRDYLKARLPDKATELQDALNALA